MVDLASEAALGALGDAGVGIRQMGILVPPGTCWGAAVSASNCKSRSGRPAFRCTT